MDNPFNTLVEIIRNQGEYNNPTPFLIGTISSTRPLLISVADIQLDKSNVMINKSLISTNHDVFSVSDKVVLLTDRQNFILLCIVR